MFLRHRTTFLGITIGFCLLFFDIFRTPIFVVQSEGQVIFTGVLLAPLKFSIWFIHSVQKTPVLENFEAVPSGKERGIVLRSTRYQSFGVGLPFLAEDGDFRKEGDYYVMDHMDRRFREISLRVGLGTQLTFFANGERIPLYENFSPGTKIDISIKRFYESK